jgi:hypothetical protein
VVTTTTQAAIDVGITVGKVLSFSSAGRSITIAGSPQQATLNVGTGVGFNATIIATFDKNNQDVRTKTLSGYQKGVITTTLNQTIGGIDSLGVSDVALLYKVYNIGTSTGETVGVNSTTGEVVWGNVVYTEVTENYVLDNGQRAEIYDHGGIILIGTAPVTNTDNLLVVYKNYSHSTAGFVFTADSYTNVAYENIPTFTDSSTGRVYNLRDCFDFRPRRIDGTTNFVIGQIPSPYSTLESNYQYY